MQNTEDSNTQHTSSQKMAMAAFIVVLVATCIIYGTSIFNNQADEIAEETVHEELAPTSPQQKDIPPPAETNNADADDEVFMIVEQMPKLIGGLASIQSNIKYPVEAKKAGIEGRVFIQFVVDKTGRVLNPVVVRGIGGGCDEEAVRAVSQARFEPGMQREQKVNVKMSLPITFKLK
ncbi:MAG: energy transducer TonB [Rhodothermaceae bacterium]|nr:energy transducer TonB [Rhodothermaceae bacterium]